jgi:hypothetical protein
MKLKIIILIILLLGFIASLTGQVYPGLAGIQYSPGSTTGDSKNFISDFSYRGFSMGYDKFVTRHISLGFITGWNVFDELNSDATLEVQGSTITGTQIRYFNAFPVMATFSFFLGHPKSYIRPYASVGAGTYFIMQRLEIGLYQIEKDNWHFGLAPAIGVLFPTDSVILQANVRFNYAFAADDSVTKEAIDISYLTFNVGISVPTW